MSDPFSLAGHPAETAIRAIIIEDGRTNNSLGDLVYLVPELAPLVAGERTVEDDPAVIAWRGYTIMEIAVERSGRYGAVPGSALERHTEYLRDLMSEAEELFVTTPATTLAGAYLQARHTVSFQAGLPQGLEEQMAKTLCTSLQRLADRDRGGTHDGELEELHRRAGALLAVYGAEFSMEQAAPFDIAALRERVAAIVAEFDLPLPEGDAGIFEAHRRLAEIQGRFRALTKDFEITCAIEDAEINPHRDRLEDPLMDHLEDNAEPRTLAAAAVMLRHAFQGGVVIQPDAGMVKNVLALIEREAGSGAP